MKYFIILLFTFSISKAQNKILYEQIAFDYFKDSIHVSSSNLIFYVKNKTVKNYYSIWNNNCLEKFNLRINDTATLLVNNDIEKIKIKKNKKFISVNNIKNKYPQIIVSSAVSIGNINLVIIQDLFNVKYYKTYFYIKIDTSGKVIEWCNYNRNLE